MAAAPLRSQSPARYRRRMPREAAAERVPLFFQSYKVPAPCNTAAHLIFRSFMPHLSLIGRSAGGCVSAGGPLPLNVMHTSHRALLVRLGRPTTAGLYRGLRQRRYRHGNFQGHSMRIHRLGAHPPQGLVEAAYFRSMISCLLSLSSSLSPLIFFWKIISTYSATHLRLRLISDNLLRQTFH